MLISEAASLRHHILPAFLRPGEPEISARTQILARPESPRRRFQQTHRGPRFVGWPSLCRLHRDKSVRYYVRCCHRSARPESISRADDFRPPDDSRREISRNATHADLPCRRRNYRPQTQRFFGGSLDHRADDADRSKWPDCWACCRWHDARMGLVSALLREHPEQPGSLQPYVRGAEITLCQIGKRANTQRGCCTACLPRQGRNALVARSFSGR